MKKEQTISDFMEQINLAAKVYGIILPANVQRCIELRLELMYIEGKQDELSGIDDVIRGEMSIQN